MCTESVEIRWSGAYENIEQDQKMIKIEGFSIQLPTPVRKGTTILIRGMELAQLTLKGFL